MVHLSLIQVYIEIPGHVTTLWSCDTHPQPTPHTLSITYTSNLVNLDISHTGGGDGQRVRLLRGQRQYALWTHRVPQLVEQAGQTSVSNTATTLTKSLYDPYSWDSCY